ncbi:MAG: hypothetical protein ACI3ZR_09030 [bacterium]
MPGSVIGINMNYGFPGQASRHGDEISRTRPVKKDTDDIYFGDPVVQNTDGTIQKFGAANTAADFAGVAMRKVKSAVLYPYQNFGYYKPEEPCDLLLRGGIMAVCAWGSPNVGADVYVRTKVVPGTSPANAKIGDFGAADETGNVVKLTGVKWSSAKDANNVAEITILNRQGV